MKRKKGGANLNFILIFGGAVILLAGITVLWEFLPKDKTEMGVKKIEVNNLEVCAAEVDFEVKMCRNMVDDDKNPDTPKVFKDYKVSIDNFGSRKIEVVTLKFYEDYDKATVKEDIFKDGIEPYDMKVETYKPGNGEVGEDGTLLLVEAVPKIVIDGKLYTCGVSQIKSYGSISRGELFDECF